MKTLMIRADAGPNIGAGHFMRCLALAQAWRAAEGDAVCLCNRTSQPWAGRMQAAGAQVRFLERSHPDPQDLSETLALLRDLAPDWIVIDGYNFDAAYQRNLHGRRRALVIDDMGNRDLSCDIVLNQNLDAERLPYRLEPGTRALFGLNYALLRKEFLEWKEWRRAIVPQARKVLVTLGGSEKDSVTGSVVSALSQLPHLELTVIAGSGQDDPSPAGVRVLRNVEDMPQWMAWADIAVTAAGSTCWELAFMGLPAVVSALAENQVGVAAALERHNVAVNAGASNSENILRHVRGLIPDHTRRAQMSADGRALVDGEGAARVVEIMQEGAH